MLNYFNWVSLPGAIHRLLAHSSERIHANSNYGLGALSEEGIESVHKMIRRFREHGARKSGLRENLEDTFRHWWIQTDPKIQSSLKQYQCQTCTKHKNSKNTSITTSTYSPIDFIGNDDENIYSNLLLIN